MKYNNTKSRNIPSRTQTQKYLLSLSPTHIHSISFSLSPSRSPFTPHKDTRGQTRDSTSFVHTKEQSVKGRGFHVSSTCGRGNALPVGTTGAYPTQRLPSSFTERGHIKYKHMNKSGVNTQSNLNTIRLCFQTDILI